MLWEITNTPHKILGSIHILPENVTLPSWAVSNHHGIKRFAIESDYEKNSTSQIGIDTTGRHLKMAGASEIYQQAKSLLSSKGVYEPFDGLLPWRAAMFLTMRIIGKMGYSVNHGIENRLRAYAVEKHIELEFLESPTRLLELVHLSCAADAGLDFFSHSIAHAESGRLQLELQKITRAWLSGDLTALATVLNEKINQFPSLFVPLVLQRNKEMGAIAIKMMSDKIPTLFVVGALHTVGEGSFNQCFIDTGFNLRLLA